MFIDLYLFSTCFIYLDMVKLNISNIKGVLKHNDYYQDRKEAIL